MHDKFEKIKIQKSVTPRPKNHWRGPKSFRGRFLLGPRIPGVTDLTINDPRWPLNDLIFRNRRSSATWFSSWICFWLCDHGWTDWNHCWAMSANRNYQKVRFLSEHIIQFSYYISVNEFGWPKMTYKIVNLRILWSKWRTDIYYWYFSLASFWVD